MSEPEKTAAELFGPELAADAAAAFADLNRHLDDILGSLRLDMIKRPACDDGMAFFVNRRALEALLTNHTFCRDMLIVAMYRLARYEADH